MCLARTCNELHREDSRCLDSMNLPAKSQRKSCRVADLTEFPEELSSATGVLESLVSGLDHNILYNTFNLNPFFFYY